MKSNIFLIFLMVIGLSLFTACEIQEVVDPNNPTLASATTDADLAQLQLLATGLEARHRGYFGSATQMFGSFGREVWAYFGSDPRFIADWLAIGRTSTYPDFFASGGTYTTPFGAVKQANVLAEAAENSSFLSASQASGVKGFAETIKGYQMIWPLMQQWDNGIRVDVSDPLNPGPFVSRQEAMTAIRSILDNGNSALQSAGSAFAFSLSSGFAGFNTPSGMSQVNRAIAARFALYDGDWQGALSALSSSFMNLNASSGADLMAGPAHVYGQPPDFNNPLFYPLDQASNTILIVHPALIEDALPGDGRLAKFAQRVNNPVTNPGLNDADGNSLVGEYQDARWTSTSSAAFIRNEELILIYAEANARTGNSGAAVDAINTIRNIWGVGDYSGATDMESLIDEVLFQRRYSLWAEAGHRYIDLRRTNRLNGDYIDLRDTGNLYTQVERPTAETNWDERN